MYRWHSSIMSFHFLIYGISRRAWKNNLEEQVKVTSMFLLNVQAPGIGTRNHHIFSLNGINRGFFFKKRTINRVHTMCKGLYQTVVSILSVNVHMLCH